MKRILLAIALLFAAGAAQAGTDNFAPNTGCTGTACTPYVNDNPELTVSFINPYYNGTVIATLNGVTYRGPANYTQALLSHPDAYHYTYLLHYEANVLADPVGTTLLLTMDVYKTMTLNRSGHNFWVIQYSVLGGTVTQ